MPNPPPQEVLALRQSIAEFLDERLTPKLEKIDKDLAKAGDPDQQEDLAQKREALLQAHEREPWLLDAARRVSQIQMATHALKFSHPDARGTNLFCQPQDLAGEAPLVSTSTLAGDLEGDVVGNAAALDVYKFLKVECQGRSLLQRVLEDDPALAAALSDDPQVAQGLMQGLASITQGQKAPASHTLARQIYFPLPQGGYHLLAPLFPTSLVHGVYNRLQEDRFSEAAKEARQAQKKQTYNQGQGYCLYPDMAVVVYGGSKPQNVSQLNSQRHGENWLLASLPPHWDTSLRKPPLKEDSALTQVFGRRRDTREAVQRLAGFLSRVPDYTNINIRNKRADLAEDICDLFLQFTFEMHQLEPAGWSAESQLKESERLWLDPGRCATDPEFAALRDQDEWRDQVARDFGIWLNAQLNRLAKGKIKDQFGDPEQLHWREQVLESLREELDYV